MCRNAKLWNGLGIRSSRIRTAQAVQAAGLHLENLALDVFLRQSPKKIRAESLEYASAEDGGLMGADLRIVCTPSI